MQADAVTVRDIAPAKINLSLDVTGQREDGYHNIDSIMQIISLADGVTVTVAPLSSAKRLAENNGFSLMKSSAADAIIGIKSSRPLPLDLNNTAVRAADLWCLTARANNIFVGIALEKNIPSGSGLGGGSANAAAVLRVLNQLAKTGRIDFTPLPSATLFALAAQIGADVPFCLQGGVARCQGIGEMIEPLPPLPKWPILLALPSFSLSTQNQYFELDLLDNSKWQRPDNPSLIQAIKEKDITGISKYAGNVFGNLSDPRLDSLEKRLRSTKASLVQLTGSGPVLFALFAAEEKRNLALTSLRLSTKDKTQFVPAFLLPDYKLSESR